MNFFLDKCIPIWPKLHNERHVLQLGNLKIEQFFFVNIRSTLTDITLMAIYYGRPVFEGQLQLEPLNFFLLFSVILVPIQTVLCDHNKCSSALYLSKQVLRILKKYPIFRFFFFFDTTVTVVVPNSYLGVTIELIQAVRVGIYVNMVFKVIHGQVHIYI